MFRLQHEGLRQGLYVRIVIRDVPAAFTDGFSAQSPLILGGLLPHETAMGLIQARVKRHRWHRRILKSNDPLIFSVGWRRYQSIPIYSLEDINERQRCVATYTCGKCVVDKKCAIRICTLQL